MMINKLIKYFEIPRHLAVSIILISISALVAVYISQYGFGLKPCHLCLLQRIPYALNIVFGFLAFLASYKYPRLVKKILWLAVLSFFIGGGIALFHTGVEQGWWELVSSCTGNAFPENASFEEFKAMITSNIDVPRCDQPAWSLFGVSMAGYNFLASSYLVLIFSYLLLKKDKFDKNNN